MIIAPSLPVAGSIQNLEIAGITPKAINSMQADGAGNIYLTDPISNLFFKVSLQSQSSAKVSGRGVPGYVGDGKDAEDAALDTPSASAIDPAGNVFIADEGNHVIRRIDATTNVITSLDLGIKSKLDPGKDNSTAAIPLSKPCSLVLDKAGDLIILDNSDGRIRRFHNDSLAVIAGGGTGIGLDGVGDGELASAASFDSPESIAISDTGDIYIADTGHNLVRVINHETNIITVVAGNGHQGYSGDFGPGPEASLNNPSSITVDPAGDLFILDRGNHAIREVQANSNKIFTIIGGGEEPDRLMPISLVWAYDDLYIADGTSHHLFRVKTEPTCLGLGQQTSSMCRLSLDTQPEDSKIQSKVEAETTRPKQSEERNLPNSYGSIAKVSPGLSGPNDKPLLIAPTNLSFGGVFIGERGIVAQTLNIANITSRAVRLKGMFLDGDEGTADFSITSSCDVVLLPHANCLVMVRFRPSRFGARKAMLRILGSTIQIPLDGVGRDRQAAPPRNRQLLSYAPVLRFGDAIRVSNPGKIDRTIRSISIDNSRSTPFQLRTDCPIKLKSGISCTIAIASSNESLGTEIGKLQITTDFRPSEPELELLPLADSLQLALAR